MSLSLALSLLRQGNNGDEILSILETIAAPEGSGADADQPE
jgi:hypothetical protein